MRSRRVSAPSTSGSTPWCRSSPFFTDTRPEEFGRVIDVTYDGYVHGTAEVAHAREFGPGMGGVGRGPRSEQQLVVGELPSSGSMALTRLKVRSSMLCWA
jgi:hypothetical protein